MTLQKIICGTQFQLVKCKTLYRDYTNIHKSIILKKCRISGSKKQINLQDGYLSYTLGEVSVKTRGNHHNAST